MSSSHTVVPLDDPYDTIGFALKQAQQALRTRMDADLRRIGLTTPQYAVLTFLQIEPGASNADLARRAFVTPQTMQAILVGLEKADYILRAPHPDHGRVQITHLTPKGHAALDAAARIVAEAERRLCEAAAPMPVADVNALLLRLAKALR